LEVIVSLRATTSFAITLSLCALPVMPLAAKDQAGTPKVASPSPRTQPRLIVAISVDQFSSQLFKLYRNDFAGGFKRLAQGAVFATGYQAQAATETCPGHSTILTGSWPWRSGIIANNWFNMKAERGDKKVYCAEDESVPGSNSENYTVSPVHLKMPTLGDRIKEAKTGGISVAVSGKDRAAVMMGGKTPDDIWWWGGRGYVSYKGVTAPKAVTELNARLDVMLESSVNPAAAHARCAPLVKPVVLSPQKSVGTEPLPTEAGDAKGFRALTAFDQSTLDLAIGLVEERSLGGDDKIDVLAVSLSATDYIGHSYGPLGPEMCTHLMALDKALGDFFEKLDARGTDYVVVLTADHGGLDIPERDAPPTIPPSARVKESLQPGPLGLDVAADLKVDDFLIASEGPTGDVYVAKDVPAAPETSIVAALRKRILDSGQGEAVFSRAEIEATQRPVTPPDTWSPIERVAVNYDAERSGDAYVVLKPHITPISDVSGYIATHGSVWDYDRQVPILFWGPGIEAAERNEAIATVDILPTLASLIALPITPGSIDGTCVRLMPETGNNCR
jgi:predicted AlkP superfamily pyrophosphatase or phosphodiesterase